MLSIDDFSNEVSEGLVNDSIDNINQTSILNSESISEYNTKKVKVLFYNKFSKIIAFDFDGVNIQMSSDKNIDVSSGSVIIEHKGTVGSSDFKVKIKE